ncbi:hypothetical protein Hdeb2414_s0004g00135991 [Helianthus debilis subsp. tardiflorus]
MSSRPPQSISGRCVEPTTPPPWQCEGFTTTTPPPPGDSDLQRMTTGVRRFRLRNSHTKLRYGFPTTGRKR